MTPVNFDLVKNKLPSGVDEVSRVARRELFNRFDKSRQGRLTLPAFSWGVANCIDIPGVDLSSAANQAFAVAWEAYPHYSDLGEKAIDWRGFRVALVYMRHYVELWDFFHEVGEDGQMQIASMDLADALPQLADWGLQGVAGTSGPSVCEKENCQSLLTPGASYCQTCGTKQSNNNGSIPAELTSAFARMELKSDGFDGFAEFADVCIKRGPRDLYEEEKDTDQAIGMTQFISAPPPPVTRPPRPSPRSLPASCHSGLARPTPARLQRDIGCDEASYHSGELGSLHVMVTKLARTVEGLQAGIPTNEQLADATFGQSDSSGILRDLQSQVREIARLHGGGELKVDQTSAPLRMTDDPSRLTRSTTPSRDTNTGRLRGNDIFDWRGSPPQTKRLDITPRAAIGDPLADAIVTGNKAPSPYLRETAPDPFANERLTRRRAPSPSPREAIRDPFGEARTTGGSAPSTSPRLQQRGQLPSQSKPLTFGSLEQESSTPQVTQTDDEAASLAIVDGMSELELNALDNDGRTALHTAASRGLAQVAKALLANPKFRSADVKDGFGWTALHCAALEGHAEICLALMDHPRFREANALDRTDDTALHSAASRGHASACEVIVGHPRFIHANVTNRHGWTALHCAAGNGHAEACVAILQELKFKALDARNMFGCTALHAAARNGHADACKVLVRHPRFYDVVLLRDCLGWTALHWAAQAGNAEVCRNLLEHQGYEDTFQIRDRRGRTPLDVATGMARRVLQLLETESWTPRGSILERGSVVDIELDQDTY